jgi:hypothetical protein
VARTDYHNDYSEPPQNHASAPLEDLVELLGVRDTEQRPVVKKLPRGRQGSLERGDQDVFDGPRVLLRNDVILVGLWIMTNSDGGKRLSQDRDEEI